MGKSKFTFKFQEILYARIIAFQLGTNKEANGGETRILTGKHYSVEHWTEYDEYWLID